MIELLVIVGVLGLLFIFACAVILPPGGGFRVATENAGLQTSRTIALAEYQYAEDHKDNYPDSSGGSAQDIVRLLMGKYVGPVYINDPSLFYIGGSMENKYMGNSPVAEIGNANISYDFSGNSGSGLNRSMPDQMPVVWSSVGADHAPNLKGTGPIAITLTPQMPFGTYGIAVAYKNNSARFITQPAGAPNLCAPEYIGTNTATVLSGGG